MPGFDGTGPWGIGPRLGGLCLGGGLINTILVGVGIYAIARLVLRPDTKK